MSAQDFGANDWLVDEMYEHYLQDPSSVDPAWVEYFKNNKPGVPAAASASSTPVSKGVPPVPKASKKAPAPQPVAPVAPVPHVQPIVRESAAVQPKPADPVVKPAPVF